MVFLFLVAVSACGGGTDPSRDRDEVWDELATKAERDGSVGVIVGLEVETVPEGGLSPPKLSEQQQRIADAQRAFLAEIEGTGYTDLKTFTPVPVVALRATPATIEAMRRSELVAYVEEDVQLAPA